jgi:hypothetical protein
LEKALNQNKKALDVINKGERARHSATKEATLVDSGSKRSSKTSWAILAHAEVGRQIKLSECNHYRPKA